MTIEELQSYELVEKREIEELHSVGYYLKHKKTGAKVCLLSNDDENKVFYIGFRTRRRTIRAWPISWSIPCCAVPESFR